MTRWHNQYLDNHAHFCSAAVTKWRPLLQSEAVNVIYREWECARARFNAKVLAYSIMPSHYHALLWAEKGESVREFLHKAQSQTSKELQPGGRFWKERPRVIPVYSQDVLISKLNYIHRNPVKHNLVENPEAWPHSSYHQLALGKPDPDFVCDLWEDIWVR